MPEPPRTRDRPERSRSSAPGPPGMAAAQQLRRAGHRVTLFERDESIGGLVRFGVPDFKIEKTIVERRVEQLRRRGRRAALRRRRRRRHHRRGAARRLRRGRARDRLARPARPAGARPRARRRALRDGLPLPAQPLGRARARPAADRRRAAAGARSPPRTSDVVVIGGGDTGADCVGNALREGARSITQLELLPEPPAAPPRRPHAVAASGR